MNKSCIYLFLSEFCYVFHRWIPISSRRIISTSFRAKFGVRESSTNRHARLWQQAANNTCVNCSSPHHFSDPACSTNCTFHKMFLEVDKLSLQATVVATVVLTLVHIVCIYFQVCRITTTPHTLFNNNIKKRHRWLGKGALSMERRTYGKPLFAFFFVLVISQFLIWIFFFRGIINTQGEARVKAGSRPPEDSKLFNNTPQNFVGTPDPSLKDAAQVEVGLVFPFLSILRWDVAISFLFYLLYNCSLVKA